MLTEQCRWAHVSPNICRNQSRGTLLRGISLPISGNFQLLGAAYPFRSPRWYFTWPSGSTCHTAIQISFKLVQWIAPTRENADFWPLSKNNTRTGNCFYSCVCIEIYNSVICCHTNPSLMHKLWQHSLLTTEHAWHKVKQKCTTTFKHINFIWILEIIVGILPIKNATSAFSDLQKFIPVILNNGYPLMFTIKLLFFQETAAFFLKVWSQCHTLDEKLSNSVQETDSAFLFT